MILSGGINFACMNGEQVGELFTSFDYYYCYYLQLVVKVSKQLLLLVLLLAFAVSRCVNCLRAKVSKQLLLVHKNRKAADVLY